MQNHSDPSVSPIETLRGTPIGFLESQSGVTEEGMPQNLQAVGMRPVFLRIGPSVVPGQRPFQGSFRGDFTRPFQPVRSLTVQHVKAKGVPQGHGPSGGIQRPVPRFHPATPSPNHANDQLSWATSPDAYPSSQWPQAQSHTDRDFHRAGPQCSVQPPGPYGGGVWRDNRSADAQDSWFQKAPQHHEPIAAMRFTGGAPGPSSGWAADHKWAARNQGGSEPNGETGRVGSQPNDAMDFQDLGSFFYSFFPFY